MNQDEALIQKLILELAIAAGLKPEEREIQYGTETHGTETLVLICERLAREFRKERAKPC